MERRRWPNWLMAAVLSFTLGLLAVLVVLLMLLVPKITDALDHPSCNDLWDQFYEAESAAEALHWMNEADQKGCTPWS